MNDRMTVDMIVNAISQGFDKVIADQVKLGQASQQSGQLIVNASGKVVDATAKAENAQKKAADTMKTRMASAAAIAAQKIDSLRKSQEALADASGKMALGFGVAAAAGAALLGSSVQLAARVETLGVVTATLGKNIGMTTEEVRALEQSLTKQGITLQASRQSIARMIQGNIDLAHATDLARLAQDAAVIAGIGSSEAFERLTTAISSGQVEMLRTMGISVTFEQGYKNLAETLGKSAEKLTELEKVQARTNIVLGAGANIAGAYDAAMGTVGKNVTSLDRHLEESRRMLGEMWLPVYADAVAALTDSLKAWQALSQSQKDAVSTTIGLGTAVAGANALVFGAINTILKMKLALDTMNASMMIAGMGAGTFAAAIALPVTAITALVAGIYLANKHLESQVDAFQTAEQAARETAKSYDEYTAAVKAAAVAEGMRVNGKGDLVRTGGQRGGTAEITIRQGATQSEADFIEARTRAARAQAGGLLVAGLQAEAKASAEAAQAARDYNFAIGKSPDVLQAAREAAELVSTALGNQAIVASGLAAGLQGGLQKAHEQMIGTLDDLGIEHADLADDLETARRKYGQNSEKVRDLTDKINANEKAQRAAREAMALTTAEMIYQQAAAGLNAEAALALARSMGVISESDYAVGASLAALRQQYDANSDGLITAEEGAANYAEQVGLINAAVQSLIDAGLPVTLDGIAKALDAAKTAAETADGKIGEIPAGVGSIAAEAATAETKMSTFLEQTVPAASETAVTALDAVTAALAAIPESKTVTVLVRTVEVGGGSVAGNPRASGGEVQAGQNVWTGESGPEPFIPAVDGRILSVSQAQQALAAGTGGMGGGGAGGGAGDVYADFNITTQPGQDPRAVARQVVQMLAEAQRAARGGAGYAGV